MATTQTRPSKTLAWKYLAVAALPLFALFYTPIVNFAILAWGEPVLLATSPVDPRDFLRGDYVRLDYVISEIPEDLIAAEIQQNDPENFDDSGFDNMNFDSQNRQRQGIKIYVALRKDEKGVASVTGATLSPPQGLYIEGTWNYREQRCDYGLGVYYIPEGTGYELERKIENSTVYADVRLLWGRGVISKLKTE